MTPIAPPAAPLAPLPSGALGSVLDHLPDPVLVVDGACRIRWGNAAAERFFGRPLEASIGACGLDLVHPDDLELALLSMVTVLDEPRGVPIEVRVLAASGWRLVELLGAQLPDIPDGIVLSVRDLTARRSYEV